MTFDSSPPKQKFPRAAAYAVAIELCALLASSCEKLVIAGSLRRGKAQVSDVEILFVPQFEVRGVSGDMFASAPVNLAEAKIAELDRRGVITRRKNSLGYDTWGPQNKLAVHVDSGIPIDFFSTDSERWWVALVIRTGSKEMNLELTTGAQKIGRKLNAYGVGVTENGHVIPANSEREVFDLCKVPYREPKDR